MHDTPRPDYRPATTADAPELARLLTLLGYPTTAAQLLARWPEWSRLGNSALVAARGDGTLAGAVTIAQTFLLHRAGPVGRITALIVDESGRRSGIGAALVRQAEEVLHAAGCGLVEVTSNVGRLEAHRFYQGIGYAGTSLHFSKPLTSGSPVGSNL